MVEPLDYKGILEKLIDKTRASRLAWEDVGEAEFRTAVENYRFYVHKGGDRYTARMEDPSYKTVFDVSVEEEILFRDPGKEEMYQILSDLFELARRNARNVPEKIATVAELLDHV